MIEINEIQKKLMNAILHERSYQISKWGREDRHEPLAWCSILRKYVDKFETSIWGKDGNCPKKRTIQLAALCFAILEQMNKDEGFPKLSEDDEYCLTWGDVVPRAFGLEVFETVIDGVSWWLFADKDGVLRVKKLNDRFWQCEITKMFTTARYRKVGFFGMGKGKCGRDILRGEEGKEIV